MMSEIFEIKTAAAIGENNIQLERYFVFTLNKCFYAVMASYVMEVVYLPELTLLNTAPLEIAGVFDLRGVIIPVIDLSLRLKFPAKPYSVTHCVVILALDSHQFGIIVDSIYDVTVAEPVENDGLLYANELNQPSNKPLLIGSLKKENLLITLLDPYVLLEQDMAQSLVGLAAKGEERGIFCPQATQAERIIFKERTENLRQISITEDSSQHLDLVVVTIADEYFSIELKEVHEFAEVNDIVPIPGAPAYIKGCMNLRGNVITLLDVRKMLSLDDTVTSAHCKAAIVEYQDIMLGVLVDNIVEVIDVNPEKVTSVPTAVLANSSSEYLTGEVLYKDKALTMINLPLLLKKLT